MCGVVWIRFWRRNGLDGQQFKSISDKSLLWAITANEHSLRNPSSWDSDKAIELNGNHSTGTKTPMDHSRPTFSLVCGKLSLRLTGEHEWEQCGHVCVCCTSRQARWTSLITQWFPGSTDCFNKRQLSSIVARRTLPSKHKRNTWINADGKCNIPYCVCVIWRNVKVCLPGCAAWLITLINLSTRTWLYELLSWSGTGSCSRSRRSVFIPTDGAGKEVVTQTFRGNMNSTLLFHKMSDTGAHILSYFINSNLSVGKSIFSAIWSQWGLRGLAEHGVTVNKQLENTRHFIKKL